MTETLVGIERKERDITHWIVIEHDEDTRPEIIDDLRAAGWRTSEDDGMRGLPPLNGRLETTLCKRGTDLFCGWTAEEKKQYLAEARKIMRKHGYTGVKVHTRPWQDFL